MAQLKKKFIGADQVDGSKIKLDNNQALRARNAANSADVDLLKLDGSDVAQITGALNASGAVTGSNLSGSNSGDVTLAAVGASPNANGATLSGQVINLELFDATNPGIVPASGGGTTNYLRADGTWASVAAGEFSKKELFTLSGTDITNQYIDLTQVAKTDSIMFMVKGGGLQIEGASHDYSVSYTGGGGGKTRITFLNDLATGGNSALIATDVVVVKYEY